MIAAVNATFQKPAGEFRTRLDLARWLVSAENPLTPRVTMNRVWMRYFGRGIVETDADFGAQGAAPTHPELLDWLGREFIRQGWSMKAMHRLIVTSAAYRQASKARPDLAEKDPRNLLLARQERVRVEAEIVRDAALPASGLLDPTIGGPRVLREVPTGDAEARIRRAFALCLCREPGARELAILRAYHTAQLADFTADTAAASKFIPDALAKISSPEAAALTAVARALFNTDNFITRE